MMDLVIFDCDGVLVNSEEIYLACELAQLRTIGVTIERSLYVATYMGLSYPEWQKRIEKLIFDCTGKPADPMFFEGLHQVVAAMIETKLTAMANANDVISQIKKKVCVASNSGTERLHWKLAHTGLAPLFGEAVFSAQMVQHGKPAPDLFLHAAHTLGAEPSRCVVIEDSINGMRGAKAAGMTVIGFAGGGHCGAEHYDTLAKNGADYVVRTFIELPPLLKKLNAFE
ncbi:HAD family hydrolase [Limoniibacter endophyticus]|uniref:Haloacid dehalogenase n=1 Tax=Limoniibacter endophyticus TaxID=1565040 RepID=A0A8J3DJW8_9HYPH|nr:HAD family hydrolase [Limoniibacter endophyticus]GHC79966.1 haloacid dehalogenase [Limoniibacter endophyticus]